VAGQSQYDVPDELRGPVAPLINALRAVEIMAFGPTNATIVADDLCCHPRTARRILHRLVADGWARQIGDPRRPSYELTLRVVAMAAQATQGSEFRQAAIPVVNGVARLTGRPVYLAIASYLDVLCLASSEGAPLCQGDVVPAMESAAGVVLLAHRHPWRESVMERIALENPRQEDDDGPGLDARLERVREQDYGVVGDELAVPVRWRENEVIGALVVAGVGENAAAGVVADVASLTGSLTPSA